MTASRGLPPVPGIDREQLSARLGRGDPLHLVMAGSDWAFRTKHLPGSVQFKTPQQLLQLIKPDEEVVVYCSNVDCHSSLNAIKQLREHGYTNVSHYAGGIIDWEAAGLPIEGEWGTPSGTSSVP
jgi:rhodanese-related sulfurtransferase